jgi:hypothetical protein
MIETEFGEQAIETLKPGDRIETRDHGLQVLKWIGRQVVPARGDLAPVRFCKGAIGNARDLLVSPMHRMLVTGWQAQLYYGLDEVLVCAKHLVNGDTIIVQPGREVEYIHLLFDDHQIVFGQGVPSESYFPGHAAAREEREIRQELLRLFPEFGTETPQDRVLVRPQVAAYEASLLAL